jgi:Translocon-associated protein beta (TRAPB)
VALSVSQNTLTSPVVEGLDFSIQYLVINNGDAPATKIEIVDKYDANR